MMNPTLTEILNELFTTTQRLRAVEAELAAARAKLAATEEALTAQPQETAEDAQPSNGHTAKRQRVPSTVLADGGLE